MRRGLGRKLSFLVTVLVLAGAAAMQVAADEPALPESAREAIESAAPKDTDALDPLFGPFADEPAALWAALLIRGVFGLLGLVLLIRWWLRWDKIRGGVLAPPEHAAPTTPFRLDASIGLWILVIAAIEALKLGLFKLTGTDAKDLAESIPITLVATTGVAVPVVAIVELRRLRLSSRPLPTIGRAFGIGVWAFSVVSFVLWPVGMLWTFLLTLFGHELTAESLQNVVRPVLDPTTPDWLPFALGGYAVILAPVIEETLFRGVLYPAIRSATGGGRRAVWIGVLVTAFLFALIHVNLFGFLPLFALAVVLAWVFERTNSLAAVMVTHGLFNLSSFVPMLLARYT